MLALEVNLLQALRALGSAESSSMSEMDTRLVWTEGDEMHRLVDNNITMMMDDEEAKWICPCALCAYY